MSNLVPGLYIGFTFQEALNGEFFAPRGTEQCLHSLGRLANATFLKGKKTEVGDQGDTSQFLYTPSWAPGVKVELLCDTEDDVHGLSDITLVDSRKRSLCISDIPFPVDGEEDADAVRITTVLDGQLDLPIRSDSELVVVRAKIVHAAQNFFVNAAQV